MPLNKSTGNMYQGWISHTWNSIKGKCYHDCSYCYCKAIAKRFNLIQQPVHLDEKEFKTSLGRGNSIFVGSSCDMFAQDITREWIIRTLEYCRYFDNIYVYQTKNPKRLFAEFMEFLPKDSVIGTTIESDIYYKEMGNSPDIKERAMYLREIGKQGFKTFVTIEPIMDFNFAELVTILHHSGASQINIGADSGTNHLTEPTKEKILQLSEELSKFATVKHKSNLQRLLK